MLPPEDHPQPETLFEIGLGPADRSQPPAVERRAEGIGPGGAARGQYEFHERIGKGGMGEVVRAHERHVRREVAVKTLHAATARAEAVARFLEEGQITGQLEHPNIVPVHELGLDAAGRPYIAMKIVRGRSLRELLDQAVAALRRGRDDPFPLPRRLDVFRKVCDAIAFAHARGVIHRDLKPENVMVGEFGEVLVMDWGLAKVLGEPGPSGGRTSASVMTDRKETTAGGTIAGSISGTPAYMSPEQAEGEVDLDPSTDVYSLGAILYELLALAPAYEGRDAYEVLAAVQSGPPPPPRRRAASVHGRRAPAVPRPLESIALAAMARDRRRRYRTAKRLSNDVEAWNENRRVSTHRDSLVERAARTLRRHPTVAASAIVAVLLGSILGAGLAVLSARADRADEARRRAEIRAMAQEGRVGELMETLGVRIEFERSRAAAEFDSAYARAIGADWSDERFAAGYGADRLEAAIAAFEEIVEASERFGTRYDTAIDHFYLGVLHEIARRDAGRARTEYDRAIEMEPAFARAFVRRGTLRMAQGDLEGALRDYDRAVEIDPDWAAARYDRGLARRRAGDARGAIEDLDRALRSASLFHAKVFAMRGLAWRDAGDRAAALADYDRALAIHPEDVETLGNRGNLLRETKEYARALADYDRAIALSPGTAALRFNRGTIRVESGDVAGAIEDLDHALELQPTYPDALDTRGTACLEKGDLRAALADFEAAIGQDPDRWLFHAHAGQVRYQLGDAAGARRAFRAALDRCQEPEWRQRLQETLEQLGE